jgi:SAM-dependent methyltransferase
VVATDASIGQLRAAGRAAGVAYAAGTAEAAPIRSGCVDLVAVAQALHWLDPAGFGAEVRRVTAPGGVLAVWGYSRIRAEPAIQPLLTRFHDADVGPWWPAERRLVEAGYEGIPLPIAAYVPAPAFQIAARLRLAELLGYLGTWSAVIRYRSLEGRDPLAPFATELAAVWGDPDTARPFEWPIFVRAGEVR